MGHYQYLVNRSNKTLFNLGKTSGIFADICTNISLLFEKELLEIYIKDEIIENDYFNKLSKNEKLEYIKWIDKNLIKLNNFIKNSTINDIFSIHDSTDELYIATSLNYLCAGSVFDDELKINERYQYCKNKWPDQYNKDAVKYFPDYQKFI